jgi:hypothetical protein
MDPRKQFEEILTRHWLETQLSAHETKESIGRALKRGDDIALKFDCNILSDMLDVLWTIKEVINLPCNEAHTRLCDMTDVAERTGRTTMHRLLTPMLLELQDTL